MRTPDVRLVIAAGAPADKVLRVRDVRRAFIAYHEWCRRNVWYRRVPRNLVAQFRARWTRLVHRAPILGAVARAAGGLLADPYPVTSSTQPAAAPAKGGR